jgi:NADH-quinone oxidoreductase subunit A
MVYIPVLILILVGLTIGGALILLSHLLGPKLRHPRKDMPFECGVPIFGDARHRFSVRFYLVAILFLLFDVEAIFFYPWAVVYKKYLSINSFILIEMGFFAVILLVGYFYVLRKGALEWE